MELLPVVFWTLQLDAGRKQLATGDGVGMQANWSVIKVKFIAKGYC
jgi:hypothetical protein